MNVAEQQKVWSALKERGFVFDMSSPAELEKKSAHPVGIYAGFDLTAPSLHAGHLVPLMALRHLQRAGHKVIALFGGATTRIGDPSDKKAERPLMDEKTILANYESLKKIMSRFLCDGPIHFVNNAEWLSPMNYIDFLRDIGRHFSVGRLLSFDFIKRRLQENKHLSFLEMNYILMQSYDFLKLFQDFDCCVQLGGQDQWANIISGTELIRKLHGAQAFAVTCPLIATASGQKMGKTASGAVWLDSEKCSAYDFWQFWRSTADTDVPRFLKLFTFLSLKTIVDLTKEGGQSLNKAKEILANEVTALVHGQKVLPGILSQAQASFGDGAKQDIEAIPIKSEMCLIDVLMAHELVSSRSEARRLVRSHAVRLGGKVLDCETVILSSAFDLTSPQKLSVGRKKHLFIVCHSA